GAILGMAKKEISDKFNDIVKFSGVEKFIDTPVKRYSSGMYVRLAFSVAAHMEPDILLVDEVLAVGDAEFQKKCLGKMDEVTKKAGRTILFVSHNMAAIQRLCKKTILLEKGKVIMYDATEKVIDLYLSGNKKHSRIYVSEKTILKKAEVLKISKVPTGGQTIKISFDVSSRDENGLGFDITLRHNIYPIFFISSAYYSNVRINKDTKQLTCTIGPINLARGTYQIDISVCRPLSGWLENHNNSLEFEIDEGLASNNESNFSFELAAERNLGFSIPPQKWNVN
ncbi:MAG: hypothetical protein Q8N21_01625, partial [bacterium]|nr:hypothetical protein [bacterium]